MKKLLVLAFLLAGASVSFAGRITSLTGPSTICPNESATYTVSYLTDFTLSGNSSLETVNLMTWEFRNNGQVFRTINATGFATVALFKPVNFSITTANLPLGTITVSVRMLSSRVIFGMTAFSAFVGSFTTNCGLAQPSAISGGEIIFPGESKVYAVTADPKATSYTWEVPVNWKVNGINGPIVSGQSNSVTITAPPCSSSVYRSDVSVLKFKTHSGLIKVRAVSSTCGTSAPRERYINVDYPLNILASENYPDLVTFMVDPVFVSFYWTIPDGWEVVGGSIYSNTITVKHNGLPSSAIVSVVSNASACFYQQSYDYQPPSNCLNCLQLFSAYPNPASTTLTIVSPSRKLNHIEIESNGAFESFQKDQVGEKSVVDVSHLEPGYHILKIVDENGKRHLIRFLKKE